MGFNFRLCTLCHMLPNKPGTESPQSRRAYNFYTRKPVPASTGLLTQTGKRDQTAEPPTPCCLWFFIPHNPASQTSPPFSFLPIQPPERSPFPPEANRSESQARSHLLALRKQSVKRLKQLAEGAPSSMSGPKRRGAGKEAKVKKAPLARCSLQARRLPLPLPAGPSAGAAPPPPPPPSRSEDHKPARAGHNSRGPGGARCTSCCRRRCSR